MKNPKIPKECSWKSGKKIQSTLALASWRNFENQIHQKPRTDLDTGHTLLLTFALDRMLGSSTHCTVDSQWNLLKSLGSHREPFSKYCVQPSTLVNRKVQLGVNEAFQILNSILTPNRWMRDYEFVKHAGFPNIEEFTSTQHIGQQKRSMGC